MIRRLLVSAVASGALLGAAGCRHKCCRPDPTPPRPFLPTAPGGPFIGSPTGPGSTIPPPGVPTTPPGPTVVPPVGPSGSSPFPPPSFGPAAPPAGSPVVPAPPPGTNGRPSPEILLPDPLPGGPSSRSMYPVPGAADGVLGAPVKPATTPTAEPPIAGKGGPASPAPAPPAATGLPGFTRVKDGLAAGRKPTLDGFDSLKRMGFKTVAFLHPPGADVAAAREVAEKRGLSFVAIETTPEKLADALDRFNKLVADKAARPVYACDEDGLRVGAVAYLHLRTVDLESGDVAKIRARALGLVDQGDEATAFWLAIQQYLATR